MLKDYPDVMGKIVPTANEKLLPSQLEQQAPVGEASQGVPLSCPCAAYDSGHATAAARKAEERR